jgi:hypothetical protein
VSDQRVCDLYAECMVRHPDGAVAYVSTNHLLALLGIHPEHRATDVKRWIENGPRWDALLRDIIEETAERAIIDETAE